MKNQNIMEKFMQLQWLFHRKQMLEMEQDGFHFDKTRGQGRILATLKMKDGIKTKDLSYILGITVVSLNETLAKLEKAGFIERQQSEQDKRVMLIYLTEKGRNAVSEEQEPTDIDPFGCLTENELQILEGYLDRMIDTMLKAMGEQWENFDAHIKKATEERERILRESNMFPIGRNRQRGLHREKNE